MRQPLLTGAETVLTDHGDLSVRMLPGPMAKNMHSAPPLIVHLIFRLAIGGLENGLVNLINRMPSHRYRHAIICLTGSSEFRNRIGSPDVPVLDIHKKEGHDWPSYVTVWRVLKQLHPCIVHTRNLPTLEYLIPSKLAGVRYHVHGEHGRDVHDHYGASRKFLLLRALVGKFVHRHVAVSKDLASWLTQSVGIPCAQINQIYNGVDVGRFYPRGDAKSPLGPPGFAQPHSFVIATVGRMAEVKGTLTLVHGFLCLLKVVPQARETVRLVMIGDGPLRHEAMRLLQDAGVSHLAWLPGERDDIPDLMRAFDLFVLPSQAEGISNTILEAMASGLPVLATRVGGNPELVKEGYTGSLMPSSDPVAMAHAMATYVGERKFGVIQGEAGRKRVERLFSLDAMVSAYVSLYDGILKEANRPPRRRVHQAVR